MTKVYVIHEDPVIAQTIAKKLSIERDSQDEFYVTKSETDFKKAKEQLVKKFYEIAIIGTTFSGDDQKGLEMLEAIKSKGMVKIILHELESNMSVSYGIEECVKYMQSGAWTFISCLDFKDGCKEIIASLNKKWAEIRKKLESQHESNKKALKE